MENFRSTLPNLKALIAFEAAARLESFTAAGQEVNLSQSAVSHCVKTLEQDLGVPLFDRQHRKLRLTRDGIEFHNSVLVALNQLSSISNKLRSDSSHDTLRIATDVGMANNWLTKRLPAFRACHPNVVLDFTVSDQADDLVSTSNDLALVHGAGDWPGFDVSFLFEEETFPVCSAAYLAQHGPIDTLDDLCDADLIDLKYEKWDWMNWTIWLTAMGAQRRPLHHVSQSNFYESILESARHGQGIALGWRRFVDDDLHSGALVVPIAASYKPGDAYYLVSPKNQDETEAVTAFRDWVAREVAQQVLFDGIG